ncbi:MAG: hypothetical protein AB1941_26275 [Gemmatimonadota bacterium]
MNEAELFAGWQARKSAGSYYRLRAAATVEAEFMRTEVPGDGYARVGFSCSPADSLSLEFAAAWPDTLARGEPEQIEAAIALAVVDEMVGRSMRPFRGCRLVLEEVGWDEVGGSEAAFRLATERALRQLRTDEAAWEHVGHGDLPQPRRGR